MPDERARVNAFKNLARRIVCRSPFRVRASRAPEWRATQASSPVFFSGAGYAVFAFLPLAQSEGTEHRAAHQASSCRAPFENAGASRRAKSRLRRPRPSPENGAAGPRILDSAPVFFAVIEATALSLSGLANRAGNLWVQSQSSEAPRGGVIMPPGRSKRASRVRGNVRPRPQALRFAPSAKRHAKTPSMSQAGR